MYSKEFFATLHYEENVFELVEDYYCPLNHKKSSPTS